MARTFLAQVTAPFLILPALVPLPAAQGAFYVLPEVSAFIGEGVEAEGWGPVPDVDALCR